MELTVSPPFFAALKSHSPQIASVRVYLEAGRDHNELTRFRYHAIVSCAPAPKAVLQLVPARCVEEIERRGEKHRPAGGCFSRPPHTRLAVVKAAASAARG